MDLRATKFVAFSANQRLGVFAEFFKLFNEGNFGRTTTATP
jgi:hypothetical protein